MLLNHLAWVSGKLGEEAALELAEKAHRLAPQSPVINDTLGLILVERGKVDQGLELLQEALRLAPQDPAIRLNLARGLIAAGKKQEARRELDALAALGERFRGQGEVAELMKKL
jgi:predicted Zn-dependent protease